jgi:membrane-associated phospholipid phosphatase
MMVRLVGAVCLLVALPPAARAQPAPLETRWQTEATIGLATVGALGLSTLIVVNEKARWGRELLWLDEGVKRNYSPAAARTSDVLLATTVLAPLALQLRDGFTRESGARGLVYGETIAANVGLSTLTKVLVSRPRPYFYSDDAGVRVTVDQDPREAHLSFFSGHASTAFAAAVGGAYLFSQSSDDIPARTAVWASSLMMAGATANLRVRAGKHFYSDVLAGAIVGSTVGVLVPALHLGTPAHALAPSEVIAIAAAPAAGASISQLVPLPSAASGHAQLVPWVTGQGAGAMMAGTF